MGLSAACFANKRYEDAGTRRCISNLLAAGFRRLEADVYWDPSSGRGHWSLCPVELGSSSQELTTSTSLVATATELAAKHLNERETGQLTAQSAATPLSSVSAANPSTTLTVSVDATTTAIAGTATSTASTNGSAIQIGEYTCSSTVDFDLLLSILSARLTDVSTWYQRHIGWPAEHLCRQPQT